MDEQHINKALFVRFWICFTYMVTGTQTTTMDEGLTTTTRNYSVPSEDNAVILHVVHTSKNRFPKSIRDDTILYPVEPTQLSNISSTSRHKPESDKASSNITKSPKDDDIATEVYHYLQYLNALVPSTRAPPSGDEKKPEDARNISEEVQKKPEKRFAFLDKMLDDYDKRACPTYGTGESTQVAINVYINSFGPVVAAQMEYGMDIYLRQMWNDPRLELSRFGIREQITLNAEDIIPQIWKPDIFFRNVKQASFHKVTVPNKLIKIDANGNILFSMRITLRLSCHMSFRHYPLDYQRCQLILGTYAQTTDQVVIHWQKKHPILNTQALKLAEFYVTEYSYSSFIRSIDTGSFSFLNVTFVLVRQNGFHIIQTYMPTFLIVMMSWVTFWLNVDATPARTTLGVTTLLTLTTVAYGIRSTLPPVSYVKAVDIWIGGCSLLVFAALLEFGFVNYLSRSKLKPGDINNLIYMFHWNKKLHLAQDVEVALRAKEEIAKNFKRAKYIDRICRFVFPIIFFLFNLVYWLYYLYVPDSAV